MSRVALLLVFAAVSLPSFAQLVRPTIYIEPQNGFETYVAAAIGKKRVPADVVTDPRRATFTLKAAPVEIKQESSAGKIARCLFAYCIGIEDKANVAVQLIETRSSRMFWAYSVNKQRGGSKNQQSMAEAVAKHFKDFLMDSQAAVQQAVQTAALDPAPMPSPVPANPPSLSVAPLAYQQPSDVRVDAPLQTAPQPVREQETLGDVARRSRQQKACLEMAKENPSVSCR